MLFAACATLFSPATEWARPRPWQPALDVYRTRDGWLVKCDLAGVRPEDVRVTLSGPRLTIQGVRRDCLHEESCRHYRMEIAYSQFERTLELPEHLDRARVCLDYQQGMLLVRLTKEARE